MAGTVLTARMVGVGVPLAKPDWSRQAPGIIRAPRLAEPIALR